MRRHPAEDYQPGSDFEPPVSLLVPAYNEAATVVASVRSLHAVAVSAIRNHRRERRIEGRHAAGAATGVWPRAIPRSASRTPRNRPRSRRVPLAVVPRTPRHRQRERRESRRAQRRHQRRVVPALLWVGCRRDPAAGQPQQNRPAISRRSADGGHRRDHPGGQWLRGDGRVAGAGRPLAQPARAVPGRGVPAAHSSLAGSAGTRSMPYWSFLARSGSFTRRPSSPPAATGGALSAKTWNWWFVFTASCETPARRTASRSFRIPCAGRKCRNR